jgi:hypothetical protein
MNTALPLTTQDIQRPRTPAALVEWVACVRRAVWLDGTELTKAKRKQGLYKEFIDEVTPLSEFCSIRFNEFVLVTPVIGNQAYDAKVSSTDGTEHHYVELTMPHDGAHEASEERLAQKRGYGTVKPYAPGQEVDDQLPFAIRTAAKKAQKDYSKCILVFVLPTSYRFKETHAEHVAAEDRTIAEIRRFGYRAKEVWVLCADHRAVQILA